MGLFLIILVMFIYYCWKDNIEFKQKQHQAALDDRINLPLEYKTMCDIAGDMVKKYREIAARNPEHGVKFSREGTFMSRAVLESLFDMEKTEEEWCRIAATLCGHCDRGVGENSDKSVPREGFAQEVYKQKVWDAIEDKKPSLNEWLKIYPDFPSYAWRVYDSLYERALAIKKSIQTAVIGTNWVRTPYNKYEDKSTLLEVALSFGLPHTKHIYDFHPYGYTNIAMVARHYARKRMKALGYGSANVTLDAIGCTDETYEKMKEKYKGIDTFTKLKEFGRYQRALK